MDFTLILLGMVVVGIFLDALSKYFSPSIIMPVPAGLTPDTSSQWGLMGLMSNINAHSFGPAPSVVTAGTNTNLTAAQVYPGMLILAAGASGGFTITLPSTASILSALGPTIPTNGTYSQLLIIQNLAVGQTGTLTAGDASTTLSGTLTIATNTTRMFLLTVNSPTAITITNFGSLSL
jgi:hypothetical protein